MGVVPNVTICYAETFTDTKEVIRSLGSKDRQYNHERKKNQKPNNNLENTYDRGSGTPLNPGVTYI